MLSIVHNQVFTLQTGVRNLISNNLRVRLLDELGNQNPKSESLIVFTLQTGVKNHNQNRWAHPNLRIRNEID